MVSVRALLVGSLAVALLAPVVAGGHGGTAVAARGGSPATGHGGGLAGHGGSLADHGGSLADHDGAAATGDAASASAVRAPDTDNTVTRIAVRADGDARWTVRIRTRLNTDEDVQQYRGFQEEFRANTSRFLDPFAGRMAGVVAGASNATGREMAAENFTATTGVQEVPRRWGVVSFSFTWTNFARVDGSRLVVGDVFEGGFLLAANDSLVVETPPGYAVRSVAPESTESEVAAATWTGREDFGDGRPRVVMGPAATPTVGTASKTATGGASGLPLGLLAPAAAALLIGVGGALYVRRSGDDGRAVGTDEGGDDPGSPVLTDAERVEQVLAENGGRMKQAGVADELGWSASKTSRVVAGMVEADRVAKLRVGRENVLDLPE